MNTARTDDKKGEALKAQRFQMLEDIACELSEAVAFPTCFDVTLKLRKVLSLPDVSIGQIAKAVTGDPLVCSRLLSLANSVMYNPGGSEITNINTVIQKLGINVVRTTALALAGKQMLMSKHMAAFEGMTRELWDHSVFAAAAAYVIAGRRTRLNRDDALLAGLVHDLGAFYMLYRGVQYEELRVRPDTLRYLVVQWHESIGESLLNALGVPEKISEAARDHDQPRPVPPVPASLADVVYVANIMAGGADEWLLKDLKSEAPKAMPPIDPYLDLLPEIETCAKELKAAFS